MNTSINGDAAGNREELTGIARSQSEAAIAIRRKSPTPRNCRNFIRRKTADAMPEIVTAFVDKAKGGSIPHFTSLTKVGGFDQKSVSSEAPRRRRKTLARQLMDEVEKYEAKQAAELAAAELEINNGGSEEQS